LRYQQNYYNRLQRDRLRLQRGSYYNSLIYNYRYNRGGSYYYTSSYGASMLRRALNDGYAQGYEAGQADRYDDWDFDCDNSYGYQDASYGYDGYYIGLGEYQYYFRQGFRRGYEDGYYGRYQYGYYNGGRRSLLGTILKGILSISLY